MIEKRQNVGSQLRHRQYRSIRNGGKAAPR
jgi:hypothetical protein